MEKLHDLEKRKSLADPFDYAIPCALIVYAKINPPFGDEAAKKETLARKAVKVSARVITCWLPRSCHTYTSILGMLPPELFLSQL